MLALPYGGGGNVTAYAHGFAESGAQPRLVAGEAAERGTTVASAIRIGAPAHAATAAEALASSGGTAVRLADEAILDAWRELAREEGVFCEPSSAAGLAALGTVELERGSVVVCVVTGHGLKDTRAVDLLYGEATVVEPRIEAILAEVR